MSDFLQTSIAICEMIDNREIIVNTFPYVDPKSNYMLTILPECDFAEWHDCTPNNPDWMAFSPCNDSLETLYLVNKHSKKIYFITN